MSEEYRAERIDEKAREIIESAFTNIFGLVPPEQFAAFLEELDGGCKLENVALCAVKQAQPRTTSERVDDFRHETWCEVGRYADRFEVAHARCPTCFGGLRASTPEPPRSALVADFAHTKGCAYGRTEDFWHATANEEARRFVAPQTSCPDCHGPMRTK